MSQADSKSKYLELWRPLGLKGDGCFWEPVIGCPTALCSANSRTASSFPEGVSMEGASKSAHHVKASRIFKICPQNLEANVQNIQKVWYQMVAFWSNPIKPIIRPDLNMSRSVSMSCLSPCASEPLPWPWTHTSVGHSLARAMYGFVLHISSQLTGPMSVTSIDWTW